MVIDWHEHIRECIRKNKLIYGFHATKTEKEYQHFLLVKYMIENSWDDKDILKWFKNKIQNYSLDLEDLQITKEIAKKRSWPHLYKYEIYISKTEIKFINELDESTDCKRFLLALLIFCKMNRIKRESPTCNKKDRSYVCYLSCGSDEYYKNSRKAEYYSNFIHRLATKKIIYSWSKQTQIRKNTAHRGGTIVPMQQTVIEGSWIKWDIKSGYKITSKNFNSKIPKFCKRHIPDDLEICPICHKHFKKSSKSKTLLCSSCYQEQRKAIIRLNANKYYQKNKNITNNKNFIQENS